MLDIFILKQDGIYVLYILATIFLGIGFYNRSALFLVFFTTLVVVCRLFLAVEPINISTFSIHLFTYLLIMLLSVGLMKHFQKIKDDNLELILALANALDSRDTYTLHHSENVSHYALEIAKKMKLPESLCEVIYKGGLLHDIGKIGIPEDI
jgi:HD-GYP domain-containing protein (c-di-GMP phosphodiesterase class II)